MTDGNQIFICFVCVSCGIAAGIVYDFLFCVRYPFHRKWVTIAADILFFALFAGGYLFVSVLFSLPSLRIYMFVGCILGFFLYLKSFHKIVAFFAEKIYNSFEHRKTKKEEGKCPKKRSIFRRKRQEESP